MTIAQKILVPSLLFVGIVAVGAAAAPTEDSTHARISYAGEGGMLKGPNDRDWTYATTNTLVLPHDTIWVDKRGVMEMELSGGTFMRLADQAKASVVSLPPTAMLRLDVGSFYVQRFRRSSGTVTFRTPACTIEVEKDSEARIDVVASGLTTVSVHWGNATLHTDAFEPVTISEGRRCRIEPDSQPSEVVTFSQDTEDDFDTWNRQRAKSLAERTDATLVRAVINSDAMPMGVYDLAIYGRWIQLDNAIYWQPTVAEDYIPYRTGYWSFVPACGYVWVGDYPFSYITCHYGRWRHTRDFGWVWSYQSEWAPAWVVSIRSGPNFLWCPLDPFNQPVCYDNAYFTVGGVRFGIEACSYCPVYALQAFGYCPAYPCYPDMVSNLGVYETYLWDPYSVNHDPRFGVISPYTLADIPGIAPRTFSPTQAFRGPTTLNTKSLPANLRVAALQSSLARPGVITSPGARIQKAGINSRVGLATARMVTLNPSARRATPVLPERASLPAQTKRAAPRATTWGANSSPHSVGGMPLTSSKAPAAASKRAAHEPTHVMSPHVSSDTAHRQQYRASVPASGDRMPATQGLPPRSAALPQHSSGLVLPRGASARPKHSISEAPLIQRHGVSFGGPKTGNAKRNANPGVMGRR